MNQLTMKIIYKINNLHFDLIFEEIELGQKTIQKSVIPSRIEFYDMQKNLICVFIIAYMRIFCYFYNKEIYIMNHNKAKTFLKIEMLKEGM